VDGTISRKYGGTGLGLAISREIARLLNGKLELSSSSPQGSTFTFYLPQYHSHFNQDQHSIKSQVKAEAELPTVPPVIPRVEIKPLENELGDDRANLQPDKPLLLVIEDDIKFARVLMDLAHQQGYQVLMSSQGEPGITLATQFKPDAITLDIVLPTINGWTVLDLLKHNGETRHIPVHVISVEEQKIRALHQGAIGFLEKPVDAEQLKQVFNRLLVFKQRDKKSLLVIEDDDNQRLSIIELLKGDDIEIVEAGTAEEALKAVETQLFDCIVLELRLPDMDGFILLEKLKSVVNSDLPIIVYTGKELTQLEDNRLKQIAETIIIKGAYSPERLLNETALFLHRIESKLPESKRKMLNQAYRQEPQLVGKKVLVVDDDVRNIFALTGLLESQKIRVFKAEDGTLCLKLLQQNPDIDLILMDIMMPELNGYETMRQIRQNSQFTSLPIIALTAKAMKGDREKCIEAGASDYISKPVDEEQLLSLLRVWLY
jgi:CheY-like chemotaxis protein